MSVANYPKYESSLMLTSRTDAAMKFKSPNQISYFIEN